MHGTKRLNLLILITILLIFNLKTNAQVKTVVLKDESFENVKKHTFVLLQSKKNVTSKDTLMHLVADSNVAIVYSLKDWTNCGSEYETPFDVHNKTSNKFGVNVEPFDGQFFIGMVVRDNGTWEAMTQRLDKPILPDTCYQMSVMAMCSPNYLSMSQKTMRPANYVQPTRLRIWGGNRKCGMDELLFASEPLNFSTWKPVPIVFKPHKKWKYIRFEAFYTEGVSFYNGNLLLDKMTDLKPCKCAENSH